MDINSLNGWQRLFVFISILWTIFAGSLYLSVLDDHVFYPHYWVELWYKLNPFASFIPLFENGNDLRGGVPTFDLLGFLYFIVFPPSILWVLGKGVVWVRDGFVRKKY